MKINQHLLAACLIILPGMSMAQTLTGDAQAGETKSQTCIACHGQDGNSPTEQNPKIAGQVPGYIAQQLKLFKDGIRVNPIMAGMVAGLSEQDMLDLDAYYSAQKMQNEFVVYENDEQKAQLTADIAAGRALYKNGDTRYSVAACQACHGPAGEGILPLYPKVSGQYASYLESQLLAYKSGERKHEMMNTVAYPLSEQQIKQVALYMSVMQGGSE